MRCRASPFDVERFLLGHLSCILPFVYLITYIIVRNLFLADDPNVYGAVNDGMIEYVFMIKSYAG